MRYFLAVFTFVIIIVGLTLMGVFIRISVGKATAVMSLPENEMQEPRSETGATTYVYGRSLVATKASSSFSYHAQDHLGSNALVFDQAGVLAGFSMQYPYGKELAKEGNSLVSQDFLFTGKEADLRLYYFGSRYYDPRLGQFKSVDPVAGVISSYQYGSNNPLHFIDPSGELEEAREGATSITGEGEWRFDEKAGSFYWDGAVYYQWNGPKPYQRLGAMLTLMALRMTPLDIAFTYAEGGDVGMSVLMAATPLGKPSAVAKGLRAGIYEFDDLVRIFDGMAVPVGEGSTATVRRVDDVAIKLLSTQRGPSSRLHDKVGAVSRSFDEYAAGEVMISLREIPVPNQYGIFSRDIGDECIISGREIFVIKDYVPGQKLSPDEFEAFMSAMEPQFQHVFETSGWVVNPMTRSNTLAKTPGNIWVIDWSAIRQNPAKGWNDGGVQMTWGFRGHPE